ncbi:MAG: WD40 repeat domain-containing protein [Phycisphaerae bacterium]|nr:WD40 repeat domain-containing protein [Phycisphaerae bacterium]
MKVRTCTQLITFHRAQRASAVLMVLVCPVCGISCEETPKIDSVPRAAITWKGEGGGFAHWGCGGAYLYGTHGDQTDWLDVWTWNDGNLSKTTSVATIPGICVTWLGNGRYLVNPTGQTNPEPSFVVHDTADNGRSVEFIVDPSWWLQTATLSANGRYVGLLFREQRRGNPDFNERVGVGLLDAETASFTWLLPLEQYARFAGNVRQVMPSDDGAYLAVVAWDCGAMVYDVHEEYLLWENRPRQEVCSAGVVFSPDNELIYTVGSGGFVYPMAVSDGSVQPRWAATLSGTEEYGHRISTVAISPDGRFIAAGTGPEGLVWLWERATHKRLKIFRHGGGTILLTHFSPDSKALATFNGGSIKIWDMPATPTTTAPTSQPAPTSQERGTERS